MKGFLLVVTGPSGVGKGTIIKEFLRGRDDCFFSVSATTRSPRPGEREGEHYHFVSPGEFDKLVKGKKLLEWAEYAGHRYGTPAEPIKRCAASGRVAVLDVDVRGMFMVRDRFPDCVTVFIEPPSWEELAARLTERGTETPAVVDRRLTIAREEYKYLRNFDYCLVNDRVEDAAARLSAIADAEKLKTARKRGFPEEEHLNDA